MAIYAKTKGKQEKPKTQAELVSETFINACADLKPNMKTAIKLCKMVSGNSSPEDLYRLQKDLDKVHGNIRDIRGVINSKLEKSADLIDTAVEKNEDKNSELRKGRPRPSNADSKKAPAPSAAFNQMPDPKQAAELKNEDAANDAAHADTEKQMHISLKKDIKSEVKSDNDFSALSRKLKKNIKKIINRSKMLKKSPSIILMIQLRDNIEEAEAGIIAIEDLINSRLKKISGFIKDILERGSGGAKSMLRG